MLHNKDVRSCDLNFERHVRTPKDRILSFGDLFVT
jgi:hypothetical protein